MLRGAEARKQTDKDTLCINTIRTLSMDAVQAANSGHPGTAMTLVAHHPKYAVLSKLQ